MEKNILSPEDFIRLANNFYNSQNIPTDITRIAIDSNLYNHVTNGIITPPKKYKVAFCWICLNEMYWEYAEPMIKGAKQFFLPGHKTDFFLWSDMPEEKGKQMGATVFPTEAQPWPIPTLMRYHLFLQQEELLKDYDYIFYCDVDMMFVNVVGDEILGQGLTVAPHPGYFTRKELYPPYEPNKKSHSFIKRPGFLMDDNGKPRFMPFYAAGGFQGGVSKEWFKAMKVMKDLVDKDMAKGYTPIWNDETVWNKYLFEVLPEDELNKNVFLTPSYIYPDSLIKEYYEPVVWGTSYVPRLVTLTKKFSVSREGGEAVKRMIQ